MVLYDFYCSLFLKNWSTVREGFLKTSLDVFKKPSLTFPNRGREPRVRVAIGARAAARRVLAPHGPLFVSGTPQDGLCRLPAPRG